MWVFIYLSLSLCVIIPANGDHEFLQFKEVVNPDKFKSFNLYAGSPTSIEVDGTSPQTVLRFIKSFNGIAPKLTIYCIVKKLSSDAAILEALICKQSSTMTGDSCLSVTDSQIPTGFYTDFDKLTGFNATSSWSLKHDLDGVYSCRLKNIKGSVDSNTVEVQDAHYHTNQMVRDRDPISSIIELPMISEKDLPMTLECGERSYILPAWAKTGFSSPFSWGVCDFKSDVTMDGNKCYTAAIEPNAAVSKLFQSIILPNGTLIILKRTAEKWRRIGLTCHSVYTRNFGYSIYYGKSVDSRYMPLDYNASDQLDASYLEALSPQQKWLELRVGEYPAESSHLYAIYRVNPKFATTLWKLNDGPLPSFFPRASANVMTFPSKIESKHAGIYTLTVKSKTKQLVFTFYVVIGGVPTLRIPIPNVKYSIGQAVSIKADFEGDIDSREVAINGMPINFASPVSLAKDIDILRGHYVYLDRLQIEIKTPDSNSLEYYATSDNKEPNNPFGASHIVSIRAMNKYGQARSNTYVAFLPEPVILHKPSDYPCTDDCFSKSQHDFHCNFKLEPYSEVDVVQTWELDGRDLSKLDKSDSSLKYLTFNKTTVTLWPALNDTGFMFKFRHTTLKCRLQLYPPGSKQEKLFDSDDDDGLRALLKVVVGNNTLSPDSASAYISWIAAVVVAVIIIIIIAILTACIAMRNKGETYLLDQEERALGNDPEKELRDRETFQVYERGEQGPVIGCNPSLNDTFMEVGSDDEGDMDRYNEDPGGFNEAGSFIGEYSNNPPRRDRLPPIPLS